MYVKVLKKGKHWFREDNGTLVGTEISNNTNYYKNISKHIGGKIIIMDIKNELKQIYYGHFVNNKFTRLSISEKCLDKTCGYYAFVLD